MYGIMCVTYIEMFHMDIEYKVRMFIYVYNIYTYILMCGRYVTAIPVEMDLRSYVDLLEGSNIATVSTNMEILSNKT